MNRGLAFAALTLLCRPCFGQDLRLVGTNLYDLGPSAAAPRSPYLAEGTIQIIKSNCIVLLQPVATNYYLVPDAVPSDYKGRGLLQYAADDRMSQKPMTAGQVYALSPEQRSKVQQFIQGENQTIFHYPLPCALGDHIHALAFPMPGKQHFFEYGKPVSEAEAGQFTNIFRAYPTGIKRESYPIALTAAQKVTK